MVTAAIDLDKFDDEDPVAFYLGPLQRELEATADVTLVVEGTHLPAHSQVLQCNSRVLCSMFADLSPACKRARCGMHGTDGQGSGDESTDDDAEPVQSAAGPEDAPEVPCSTASKQGSKKRKWSDQQDQLVLEAPFQGSSLQDVALFLRLIYGQEWREAVAATLGALHDSLPALLRLAHRLDASILGTLTNYMADVALTTFDQLSSWLKAAADCQLEQLRLTLLACLARRLAAKKERLPNSLALLLEGLEGLDARTLSQLVAILAAAGEPPSSDSLAMALDKAAEIGSAEWMLPRFSQQPRGPNECVYSPWFDLEGHEWRLSVFPGGVDGSPKYLAVFLHCGTPGVRADYEVAVLDENLSVQEVGADTNTFETSWGFSRLIRLSALRRRGLLAGDCLRLRVTLTVLPSPPNPAPAPSVEAAVS